MFLKRGNSRQFSSSSSSSSLGLCQLHQRIQQPVAGRGVSVCNVRWYTVGTRCPYRGFTRPPADLGPGHCCQCAHCALYPPSVCTGGCLHWKMEQYVDNISIILTAASVWRNVISLAPLFNLTCVAKSWLGCKDTEQTKEHPSILQVNTFLPALYLDILCAPHLAQYGS